ncbi:hypothetical protein Z517_06236 [Fonsecaea pedrosoi CBS 271.37]|uniref:Unplaced genomic scaffold supercont1.4, whole genome shotgun sequence n=1 Tax=Fonsecaea pedrosoi CBS 271.37 TaxID=1442368 RepID=A0A0D2GFP4_9EURO|nr:uncharacterized protein Z517_06236 [Fonsecaea pedrosoi CBS 271.37]KIW79623.1 hypothetical protein Z517_06236 [Fonsecaea pedrosoi CBS 271.37]
MEAIVEQIQALAKGADDAERSHIVDALQQLQHELESPMDVLMKMFNAQISLSVTYVAVELGLFQELVKHDSTVSGARLTANIKASAELVERLLRYLASVGFLDNPGSAEYRPNKITHFLASPVAAAGVHHALDTCGPAIQALPAFLAETQYQDITENKYTPFQKGHKTNLGAFEWLAEHPENFLALQQIMTAIQSAAWLKDIDVLNSAALDVTPEPERPFFVDVGGGHGHQCKQLLNKYPNLCGSVILEDLPQTVDKLPRIDGVKVIGQDFFERQAVQGARFYYLRRIMHDWPDAECLKILSRLSEAMASDSLILIDEIVLPDANVPWQAAMQDVSMNILFAGKERTNTEWTNLIASSGLQKRDILTYNHSACSSVIVLGK